MNNFVTRLDARLHKIIIEQSEEYENAKKQFNNAYKEYIDTIQIYGSDSNEARSKLELLKKAQDVVKQSEPSSAVEPATLKQDSIATTPAQDKADPKVFSGGRYADPDYKDPRKGDRQEAEDALFHTVGPLTSEPKWVTSGWSSAGNPPPDFKPGGDAPRWTPEQIIFAMAGDPSMLFTGQNNHPLSPQYGNKGGSPLFRKARQLARQYGRPNDRTLISDLYQNGFIPLLRMMQPGFDEGRSPFISYVIRNIESGMGHGSGGTKQSQAALGYKNEDGTIGFKGLLELKNANDIRQAANQIAPKFREQPSHEKDPGNPLGKYSAQFYKLASEYAAAIESNDDNRISKAVNDINQAIEQIEDENVMVLGASTGVGQAISTPDRKTSVSIASMDAPASTSDDTGGMASNIAGSQDEGSAQIEKDETTEVISLMLERAMQFDFGTLGEKWKQKAVELGAKGAVKFSGPLNITQLRYTIRTLGQSGSNYPGKGNIRKNTQIPREARGWCSFGEDPELEPIPSREGATWRSDWVRKGFPSIGSTDIAAEMTREVLEFEKLGVATARSVKSKAGGKEEVVSKNAVSNALTAAKIKLMILAEIERDQLGIDESKITGPLLEDIRTGDKLDRELIAEACDWACVKIDNAIRKNDSTCIKFDIETFQQADRMRPIDSLEYID